MGLDTFSETSWFFEQKKASERPLHYVQIKNIPFQSELERRKMPWTKIRNTGHFTRTWTILSRAHRDVCAWWSLNKFSVLGNLVIKINANDPTWKYQRTAPLHGSLMEKGENFQAKLSQSDLQMYKKLRCWIFNEFFFSTDKWSTFQMEHFEKIQATI